MKTFNKIIITISYVGLICAYVIIITNLVKVYNIND